MSLKNFFSGSGFKKILFTSIIVIILIIAGSVYWNYYFTYSEGYRSGLLQKFSYKGTIFKTYEGEMILSSVQSNRNVAIASEKFEFSVADEKIAMMLDTLQGKNVTLHYRQKNGTLPWRGNSTYIVDDAKISR
ncbi:MAG: hypothetical protein ACM3PT_02630 [Deltaproteobacteria bacterium]